MSSVPPAIVWFRQDLRLRDNPALHHALQRGGAVVPVFIWDPESEHPWEPGGASRWWLHQSLKALGADLERLGAPLILRQGESLAVLRDLIRETGADAVFWNRRYEPVVIARDSHIKSSLQEEGLEVSSFNAALLFEPWTVKNKSGKPFQVFTPFWKHCLTLESPPLPLPVPKALPSLAQPIRSELLDAFSLEPTIPWDQGMREHWQPGEAGAQVAWKRFLKEGLPEYADGRDRLDREPVSKLSSHLHFGEISPRQLWHEWSPAAQSSELQRNGRKFLSEVGWREFAHHLLFHFPDTPGAPLRENFGAFPWESNEESFQRWAKGRTGIPVVDAAMRDLWHRGIMPNRARMIVASFLTKNLLIDWRDGARWFWDTLVDADLANNTLGWQWTAGCGADAAPFFRIFNPVSQGEKFDPDGDYIRRWVPELAALPVPWIFQPWETPREILRSTGFRPGIDYPEPMVDLRVSRNDALDAYARIKKA